MKQLQFVFTLVFIAAAFVSMAQDSTHKDIIGRYKFPSGSVVEEVAVAAENGGYSITSSAGVSALTLIKGDTFNIVNFNGIAVFKRNDTKKITGVHIDASGYVLDGVKDSATVQVSAATAIKSQPVTIVIQTKAAKLSDRVLMNEKRIYRTVSTNSLRATS